MRGRAIGRKEATALLESGEWEIGRGKAGDFRTWIQRGGVGKGGESKTLRFDTFLKLLRGGTIVLAEDGFPTQRYRWYKEREA